MSPELADALAVLRVCAEHNDGAIAPDHAKALLAEIERLREAVVWNIGRADTANARLDKVRALVGDYLTNDWESVPEIHAKLIQALDGSDQ